MGTAVTYWFTGLSASGKTTLSHALSVALQRRGIPSEILDGDDVRRHLSADLGFSRADRLEQLRRVAWRCREGNARQLVMIAALISPFGADRELAKTIIGPDAFLEIHLSTPLAVCEARDPKGLYRQARQGKLSGFTGIDDPYEPPASPHLTLNTSQLNIEECIARLLLLSRGEQPAGPAY